MRVEAIGHTVPSVCSITALLANFSVTVILGGIFTEDGNKLHVCRKRCAKT
jgi:hypothetical protein